jgi:uncharacterized protein YndB with AHSA1/START domain
MRRTVVEFGAIEREIYIEASPDVVFDVVSKPEHIREWWCSDARVDVVTGGEGMLTFTDMAVAITVVKVDRPHLFSFRWVYPEGQSPREGNSMLVEFRLVPEGTGTLLRLTESGLREIGWDEATKAAYAEGHEDGWDRHLPDLRDYAEAYAKRAVRP